MVLQIKYQGSCFALFAAHTLEANTVIGEYVGVVTRYRDLQHDSDLLDEFKHNALFDITESQYWGINGEVANGGCMHAHA